jgi:hypothetical protein
MATKAAVASDGSYVWSASSTGFQVFSSAGIGLFSVSGDYSHAAVFAAPGEARIANGGKGTGIIELLAIPAGTSTTSPPLQGTFHSWFADGSQLLTLGGGVLHAYTKTGTAGGMFLVAPSVTKFGGIDDFVWLLDTGVSPSPSYLNFYPASGSAMPTASLNVTGVSDIVPTSSGLGILYTNQLGIDVVTFPAGKPATTRVTASLPSQVMFALDAGGTWSAGSTLGLLYYGDPMNAAASGRLGYGVPLSLGSSGATGTAAVAAVGFPFKTLAFDLSETPTRQFAAIDFGSAKIRLSSDGSLLAASEATYYPNFPEMALKAFSLPMGTELNAWPYTPQATCGISCCPLTERALPESCSAQISRPTSGISQT